jgi:hypothetical protein
MEALAYALACYLCVAMTVAALKLLAEAWR